MTRLRQNGEADRARGKPSADQIERDACYERGRTRDIADQRERDACRERGIAREIADQREHGICIEIIVERENRERRGQCKALRMAKSLAPRAAPAYDYSVPEKKGTWLGRRNRKKRTNRAMRFFYVCMPLFVSYERRWRGSPRACWFFFFHQSTNPATCRPPRLVAGRGLTVKKEAHMPSSTRTSVQSRAQTIACLAGNANTVAALLSVIEILPAGDQDNALSTCASIAAELAHGLEALVGGVA